MIFSVPVMMKFIWKDLGLDYAQETLDTTHQFTEIMAAWLVITKYWYGALM